MRTQRLAGLLAVPALIALSGCGGTTDAATADDHTTDDDIATLLTSDGTGAGDVAAGTDDVGADADITADEAALQLSECLRSEGLDVADIGVDETGNIDLRSAFDSVDRSDGSFREAMDACRDIIADVGFGGGRGAGFDATAIQDAFLEFSGCIRDQGFEDVPDLAFEGPGAREPGNPPADGDPPADGAGEGERRGGFGDRTTRFAEGLGLDPDDPDVIAAMDECAPIIDLAFTGAAGAEG